MFRENVTKTDIFWGLYRIHIFDFFTHLLIFLPRLEILLCINYYCLVCIFKYRTSTRVLLGYKIRDTIFIQTISAETSQKREQQQQQQQKVSAVRSPDEIFTVSNSSVLLFRQISANLQLCFRFALIFIQSIHQQQKKRISATATATT